MAFRSEYARGVRFSDVKRFEFNSTADVAWVVQHKEFINDGVLYDVLEISYSGDNVNISAYADRHETHLTDQYHQYLIDTQDQRRASGDTKKIDDVKYHAFDNPVTQDKRFALLQIPLCQVLHSQPEQDIVTPPPKGLL